MKISDIDEDFVDIINYLNENGFKPFASCDGVSSHHSDPSIISAYIAFMKSPKIIDIIAAFLRDKDRFKVTLTNEKEAKPYILYGNEISGNTYQVHFANKLGEVTSYFEKVIKGVSEGNIKITEEEKKVLNLLDDILEEDLNTDLNFDVSFNNEYQPYMNKNGKINVLRISTKDGYGYKRCMGVLADIKSEKYNMKKKKDSFEEKFEEEEFIIPSFDDSNCEIYFIDEHILENIELIRDIRQIGKQLPTKEIKEIDYDMYDESIDYFEDEPNF